MVWSSAVATSRRERLKRYGLVALALAGACVVVVVGLLLFKLFSGAPSKATEQKLSTAASVAAILGGVSSFLAFTFNFLRRRIPDVDRATLVMPQLLEEAVLVDRTTEVNQLITCISRSRVVNCCGDRGAGKSYLLAYLADVVNGFRPRNSNHKKPRGIKGALYFDLADAVGFEEIEAHVCREVLGTENGTWNEFVTFVNKSFARKKLVLILDNVNTPGLWPAVGRAAYQYLKRRPKDKLVLGSVSRISVNNLPRIDSVPVEGLDFVSTEELVASNGIAIDKGELASLHRQFKGLPFYIGLLAPFDGERTRGETDDMEAAVEAALVPRLDARERDLLAYASLLSVVSRPIPIGELERCPLPELEARLDAVRGMLAPVPGGHHLKIHDVLRDVFLRALTPEVSQAAVTLFEQARSRSQPISAALFAMFADPERIGEAEFDGAVEPVIKEAVKARNYAVLDNLHHRASQSLPVLRFIGSSQRRHDLFCYARASQLAGVGEYAKAEEKLLQSSINTGRVPGSSEVPEMEAEMRFLLADIAHLQNRYDDAALMFGELGEWAESVKREGLHARCTWGRGHVLRHQGKELDEALSLFGAAIELAEDASELFAKSYSITGATGIKVFLEEVPPGEEDLLGGIEDEIAATQAHDSYMLEVWKSQAQVAWLRGRREVAFGLVEDAIKKALAINDRLLYNLYFERAEFLRLGGRPETALADYRQVLEFGEGNGDRNLISNARIGLALADLATGHLAFHGSPDKARGSVMRARQVALEADIHATAGLAERAVAMIEGADAAGSDLLRLILF